MARRHDTTEAPAPPGWPRTPHPLRIAILGWARLSLGAREGSGYNLSASELAAGLAMSGHEISYLRSGMRYSIRPGMRVAATERWRGVECFELINSPNCSPAAMNFTNTRAEISSPAQTRAVLAWLDRVGAEVVHIHSLEGCPFDLIPAIAAGGRPVVVTPHNYWFVCPQVDLLRGEVALCRDFAGGSHCQGCLPDPGRRSRRAKRALVQSLERTVGSGPIDLARWIVTSPRRRAEARAERLNGSRRMVLDPELAAGFAAEGERGPVHDIGREPKGVKPASPILAIDENERFLAADHHLKVLDGSPYGRRRVEGIAALNAATVVTPPSEFLGRAHVAMGLEGSKVCVVRLGQPHFDQIHRRTKRSAGYDRRPWSPESPGPLRFAFLGVTRPNKGLDVMVRAIEVLDAGVRRRCQFLVRAGGWDWPFRRRVAGFPEVQFAGGYDLMQLIAAGGEYDVGILPHIWFENSPLVLLEHLHAGKFVIASRLGGPPEWIVEPRSSRAWPQGNGVMFAGGDPAGLAGCIARLVRGEVELPSAREVHAVTPNLSSYPEHVREVERVYAGAMGRGG